MRKKYLTGGILLFCSLIFVILPLLLLLAASFMPEDELLYLMVHVNRLYTKEEFKNQ